MDQVVVSAIQPLDLDYDGASQVRQNIDSGNIRYVYFFQGNKEGAQKTCELLQIILLANILKNQHDVDNWPSRLEKLKINSSQIIDDLKLICDRERIKIFFFPAQPPSVLQYCIHNAGSTDNAKLYLKRKKDEYIEWVSGLQAYQFWDGVRQARGALNPLPPKAVIYGIPGFNVKEGAFLKILEEQVTDHFPEIDKDILRLCLEGTDEKSQ